MMELGERGREEGGRRGGRGGLEIGGDERLRLSKADSTSSEGQFFQRRKWRARAEADSLFVCGNFRAKIR
jgi:hypothetical protein